MKILIVLTYYVPYVSGITEFARLVAEELSTRHKVTVLTMQYDPSLPEAEVINGVSVIRSSVLARVHKGALSLSYFGDFRRLAREHDVVNVHVPMLEAGILSYFCDARQLVVTYHCDMAKGKGVLDAIAIRMARWSARVALRRARRVAVTSMDYALSSEVVAGFSEKTIEVAAPIKDAPIELDNLPQRIFDPKSPRIGFVGRFVEEKGLPVLLSAFRILRDEYLPNAKLVLIGDSESVAGGSVIDEIKEEIEQLEESVELHGKVSELNLWSIYSNLDLLVLPSVNRYEAFGMVQIEAMMSGALVVSTNLPGVRTIVERTGCGKIAEVGDPKSLLNAMLSALEMRSTMDRSTVRRSVEEVFPDGLSTKLQEIVFNEVARQHD